ncbi:hypothetical protein Lbir_1932 [Legionella birminghamensis]|uniref:Transmembrane protein n=1 Tax=Legionella birminghamensis TaxID=28083 RepID=A0A378JRE0_9GAMM|nr:hypothetical protein [Legionella birminghamensis]KTC69792.1 hypothetical protein Lbir_1932 [Legionella birminghamensis]STX60936.1 Uncharacterised protein [Legionella birminghamensis]
MNDQKQFQEALTHDLNALATLKVKTLSGKQVYIPYLKMMGRIYLLLCVLAIAIVKLSVLVGFHMNRSALFAILNKVVFINLIPLFFLLCGLGQGFILWTAIQSELKSAPFIQTLMKHYLKCYLMLYGLLLLIGIVVFRLNDLEMLLMGTVVFSLVLSIFFFNMEAQRLGQGVLIQQIERLFSQAKAAKRSD